MLRKFAMLVAVAVLAVLAGCYAYVPAPGYYTTTTAPPPPSYDQAWSAALGALQDNGVRVTSADNASGMIRGIRDASDVTVTVRRLADGTVQVDVEARNASGRQTGLASAISSSYKARMGL